MDDHYYDGNDNNDGSSSMAGDSIGGGDNENKDNDTNGSKEYIKSVSVFLDEKSYCKFS